jgi:hypothetical protein
VDCGATYRTTATDEQLARVAYAIGLSSRDPLPHLDNGDGYSPAFYRFSASYVPADRARWICADCLTSCTRCGSNGRPGIEVVTVITDVRDGLVVEAEDWCENCRGADAQSCHRCGGVFSVRDVDMDDDYRCPTCTATARAAAREQERGDGILGYHSDYRRSRSQFHHSDWTRKTGWHIGVELEVELHRSASVRRAIPYRAEEAREQIARQLLREANGDGRRLWAEADGSLSQGFELISEPMGLDGHRSLWPVVLSSEVARFLQSHQTTTCGLHVHVSRRGITRHQLARVNRLLALPEAAVFFGAVARRWGSSYGMAKTTGFSGEREVSALSRGTGRYEALNLTNSRTVEFRLWRGSLLPQAVLASVEASVAMLRYAKAAAMAEVGVAHFLHWLARPEQSADTVHLRPYIRQRLAAAARGASREEAGAIAQWLAILPAPTGRHAPPAPQLAAVSDTDTEL